VERFGPPPQSPLFSPGKRIFMPSAMGDEERANGNFAVAYAVE
jgi:hypothetical protein